MLEGINYWDAVRESPSRLEICFANVLKLDDHGGPVSEKHAERCAATWLYRYCTGDLPPGEPSRTLNHGSARSTNTRNLLLAGGIMHARSLDANKR